MKETTTIEQNDGKIYIDIRLGGIKRYFLGKPNDWDMKVKREVLKCIVFFGIENNGNFEPIGTGFFIGVPYENEAHRQHVYLVTAKHNIDPGKGNCNAFSVNTKDGNIVINFQTSGWYDPLSESADICLRPIEIADEWDVLILPVDMITPKELIGSDDWITTGSDVFITGLFTEFSGKLKNHPIVRKGSIAMMPTEKINSTGIGLIDAYLIEVRSVSGLSGSPVFWYATSNDIQTVFTPLASVNRARPSIQQEFWGLLGLVQGHYPISDDKDVEPVYDNHKGRMKGEINAGIASVTPASKINDILMRDELKKQRREDEEIWSNKKGATPD